MGAGAEGHAGVQPHHHVAGLQGAALPGGADDDVLSDAQGVVIFFPAKGPVLLLDAAGAQGMGDALGFQAFPQEGDRLGGVGVRADIQVNDRLGAVLLEQVLINKVDMGDFRGLLQQVGVVLNINAVGDRHLGDGRGLVGIGDGDFNLNFGPFLHHKAILSRCRKISWKAGQKAARGWFLLSAAGCFWVACELLYHIYGEKATASAGK